MAPGERYSAELFSHLDVVRDGIEVVSAELVEAESFPRMVPDWFGTLWDIIRATIPVLKHAVRALDGHPDDDFTRALRQFYTLKLDEESGHDDMLVADLGRLGVTREELSRRIPSAAVTAMVGSQYYFIDYVHPAAYLGYVGLLEGYPAPTDQLDNLIARSGTPPEAWSTYRMHAEVDTWHRQELEAIVDLVPADASIRRAIVTNGLRAGEFYCQALEELVARAHAAGRDRQVG